MCNITGSFGFKCLYSLFKELNFVVGIVETRVNTDIRVNRFKDTHKNLFYSVNVNNQKILFMIFLLGSSNKDFEHGISKGLSEIFPIFFFIIANTTHNVIKYLDPVYQNVFSNVENKLFGIFE